jgi:hypothetical protein
MENGLHLSSVRRTSKQTATAVVCSSSARQVESHPFASEAPGCLLGFHQSWIASSRRVETASPLVSDENATDAAWQVWQWNTEAELLGPLTHVAGDVAKYTRDLGPENHYEVELPTSRQAMARLFEQGILTTGGSFRGKARERYWTTASEERRAKSGPMKSIRN